MECLQVPHGTRLVAGRGADFVHQFNEGIRRMTGDWVWILGDDHTFSADILLKMLDRQVDFLVPIVPRRDFPFSPVLMHGPIAPTGMLRYSWQELPIEGMLKLPIGDTGGQAGALVRKPVLDKIGDPWFEGGKLTPGRIMEDMYFLKRVHDIGVDVFVDCNQVMGHIANITVLPQRHEGRWYPGHMTERAGAVFLDEPETSGWGNNFPSNFIKRVA
jgi:hypothetical protein